MAVSSNKEVYRIASCIITLSPAPCAERATKPSPAARSTLWAKVGIPNISSVAFVWLPLPEATIPKNRANLIALSVLKTSLVDLKYIFKEEEEEIHFVFYFTFEHQC